MQSNLLAQNYMNNISSNGFEIASNEATRVTDNSKTCLDHFIFQNISVPNSKVLNCEKITEYYPITLE